MKQGKLFRFPAQVIEPGSNAVFIFKPITKRERAEFNAEIFVYDREAMADYQKDLAVPIREAFLKDLDDRLVERTIEAYAGKIPDTFENDSEKTKVFLGILNTQRARDLNQLQNAYISALDRVVQDGHGGTPLAKDNRSTLYPAKFAEWILDVDQFEIDGPDDTEIDLDSTIFDRIKDDLDGWEDQIDDLFRTKYYRKIPKSYNIGVIKTEKDRFSWLSIQDKQTKEKWRLEWFDFILDDTIFNTMDAAFHDTFVRRMSAFLAPFGLSLNPMFQAIVRGKASEFMKDWATKILKDFFDLKPKKSLDSTSLASPVSQ